MKMRLYQKAAATALLLVSAALYAQTVVTVNGTPVDSKDVERRARIFQANSNGQIQDGPELRNEITRELIIETLVTQEAKRLKLDKGSDYQKMESEALKALKAEGLDKDKNFQQNWADYRNHLLMRAYALDIARKNPISDAELRQQYQRIADYYRNSEEVQLGLIVTDKAEQARAALKELKAKKKFSEVAAKYSLRADAKQTGGIDPEYMPLKNLKEQNPTVYQAVSGLGKGQYTPSPLQEGNIGLILYVNDKRKVQLPAFEALKPEIEQNLHQIHWDAAVDALGQKAKIVPAK